MISYPDDDYLYDVSLIPHPNLTLSRHLQQLSSTIMALIRLPAELLDNIITYVLPEGFASLALTCKKTFALCTPFIEHHNHLRSHFHEFAYCSSLDDPYYPIKTAFDLISRIAVEPVVARYVRHADFEVSNPQKYCTSS